MCDCYAGGYKCEQTCLENALVEESVYATVGTNLYNNVTYMYPNANIWLTGHSVSVDVFYAYPGVTRDYQSKDHVIATPISTG